MPTIYLKKNRNDTVQPIAGENKGFILFSKCISPKMNIIAWLEFELTHYDVAVQHVSRSITKFLSRASFFQQS